uniref:(northern house mosquito) hypothetical protein n=1 Tax=Culex pipiens TaxID=7175 RepID=A0A8D8FUU5_CULPI
MDEKGFEILVLSNVLFQPKITFTLSLQTASHHHERQNRAQNRHRTTHPAGRPTSGSHFVARVRGALLTAPHPVARGQPGLFAQQVTLPCDHTTAEDPFHLDGTG